MYQRTATLESWLPRFLTPPRSVRDLLKGIAGAVWRGTTVTIPTPVGPQTFNVGDPAQRAQLEAMIRGTRLNVATPEPGAGFDLGRSIEKNVPGGWATVGIGVLLAVFLLGGALRPRRA